MYKKLQGRFLVSPALSDRSILVRFLKLQCFISRANIDAINVHPLEFFLGEYNHLWSLCLCTRVFNVPVHALGVLLFLVVGGALAGLNHTRFNVEIPLLGVKVFDSKAHDGTYCRNKTLPQLRLAKELSLFIVDFLSRI